jgi:DNA-binding transcriptional LysR family regulator
MSTPHITLEQWRALLAVVDAGGYAQAAEALHKSQSSVTYAVQKLQSVLGVKAFEIQGRKAILTPTGQTLYRRARVLLEEASGLEKAAGALSAGWEAEIRVVVEHIFPTWLMLDCLARFGEESPHTHIELIEAVMSGTEEALLKGQADIAVTGRVPPGFAGDALLRMSFILAANPAHPLHHLGRVPTYADLRAHRQFVVRESGTQRGTPTFLDAKQRWTVSHMSTSIEAARLGHGYGWFPEYRIRNELAAGTLKRLDLSEGGERYAELYLVVADRDTSGPGTRRLAEIIRESVSTACSAHATPANGESTSPSKVAKPRSRRRNELLIKK